MMRSFIKMNTLYCFVIALCLMNCTKTETTEKENSVYKALRFKDQIEVLIIGTFHFDQETNYDELSEKNQLEIDRLLTGLEKFGATKVFIEKSPLYDSVYNARYQEYLTSEESIDSLRNEIYQLGFRMAKRLQHDAIYLFDNKPDFIGSLEDFSFSSFAKYADSVDTQFNKKHHQQISEVYTYNDSVRNSLGLYSNIKSLNSAEAAQYDIARMHAIEIRVGVDHNWIGADWLGRWYQRNIRMMMHVLRQSDPGDKVILFVGSNHKWVLEQLMKNTPELQIVDASVFIK